VANQWLRLWHDLPNDPKWRTIARVSKQSIGNVIAVYMHLLVNASNASERGRTQNVSSEDIASALDIETEQVDAILAAMQGRVLEGDLISGWSKRQPEREDGAAERAKAWREAKKAEKAALGNADQTQANAGERKQTLDKDKSREELNPPIPPKGGEQPEQIESTRRKAAISLQTYLDDCRKAGIKAIPEGHAVFAYATKVGIPDGFLRLHWHEFKDRYTMPDAKRYKSWATVFHKSVKGNWFRLWYAANDGTYALTTTGQQAQRDHGEAA
jgi:hypothetical protein